MSDTIEYIKSILNLSPDPVSILSRFIANSAHLQIVGLEEGVGPFEIEVQSPLDTYLDDNDWDVYWTEEGEPRPHNALPYVTSPGQYAIKALNLGEGVPQSIWDQAISIADAIQDEVVGYGVTQNSNTFVTSVMWTWKSRMRRRDFSKRLSN